MKTNKSGFTLIELLVAIAIIALLISLLIPAVQSAREMARRSHCSNNVKQLALSMHTYHESLKTLPPGNLVLEELKESSTCHPASRCYCASIGWPVFLLPYLEQMPLYERVDFETYAYTPEPGEISYHQGQPHGATANQFVGENMPALFSCPSVLRIAPINSHKDYGVNGTTGVPQQDFQRDNAAFHANSGTRFSEITRGLSNTYCLLEQSHSWWWSEDEGKNLLQTKHGTNPFFWVNMSTQGYVCMRSLNRFTNQSNTYVINSKTEWSPNRTARSYHPGGINVAMFDGSVPFLSEKMDKGTYNAAFYRIP